MDRIDYTLKIKLSSLTKDELKRVVQEIRSVTGITPQILTSSVKPKP